jgi:uncharacterized SAM-binding protein YcdF (DUF218 family)
VSGFVRAVSRFCAVVGVLTVIVCATPVDRWWAEFLGGRVDPASADVLVVLAASSLTDGLLGESSYWRSAFAVREFHAHAYKRIILSGGGKVTPSIAMLMQSFLIAAGVPKDIIELEDRSTTTHESAMFTARMLMGETQPVALVTSDYHMFRSARLFQKEGLKITRRPYADAAARAARWSDRPEVAFDLMLENTKIVYYKLRGWI